MAEVKIMVGGRQYGVHCRDGEEAQVHHLAGMISDRVNKVSGGNGGLTEVRQLLYAALLLADELVDQPRAAAAAPAAPPASPPVPQEDPALVESLEQLAIRAEALADSLAAQAATS